MSSACVCSCGSCSCGVGVGACSSVCSESECTVRASNLSVIAKRGVSPVIGITVVGASWCKSSGSGAACPLVYPGSCLWINSLVDCVSSCL